MEPALRLSELAREQGLERVGSDDPLIDGVCGLVPGRPGALSFLSNPRLRSRLAECQAAAVIVSPRDREALGDRPGLLARDPYLAYARIARRYDRSRRFEPGQHPSAVIAASARIEPGCRIGALCVIGESVVIGAGSYLGDGCIVEAGAQLGSGCRLEARVVIGHDARLGQRCLIQPGAVIGSRGFGNARGPAGWEEVPQLGSVVLGDDVEVGANTTIDRGALEDTLIGNGVKLDNQIQIAHNCVIGEHTAIAACTGIAGSTRIGRHCLIGGAVGISGHLEIGDEVMILARAMVTHSLPQKGVYGSGLPVDEAREWRKTVARVRRLGRLEARLKGVEQALRIESAEDDRPEGAGE